MSNLNVDLSGQVAIVTGAGGGLGRAFARALAASGASVVAADMVQQTADETARLLSADGLAVKPFCVDVTDERQTAALADFAKSNFGRIDILVNNAAYMEPVLEPLLQYSMDKWDRTLAVNLTGPLNCIRAVADTMKAQRYGRIVNIASGGAYTASHVYGISKLALLGLNSYLAGEFAHTGVTINAISPGMMQTARGARARGDNDESAGEWTRAQADNIPLKPVGEPEDLIGALLFLCSDGAAWMTGDALRVDGGWIKSVL